MPLSLLRLVRIHLTAPSGSLEGTLLAHGNTINVISAVQPLLDGALFPTPLIGVVDLSGNPGPVVTLDGSFMSFLHVSAGTVSFYRFQAVTIVTTGTAFTETYSAANWTITERVVSPPSTVPLPAGALLLLIGLGGVVALKRRKVRAA